MALIGRGIPCCPGNHSFDVEQNIYTVIRHTATSDERIVTVHFLLNVPLGNVLNVSREACDSKCISESHDSASQRSLHFWISNSIWLCWQGQKKKKKGQMVVNKKTLFLNQSEKPSSQRRVRKETHSLFVMTCSGHCGAGTGRLLLLLVLFGTLRVLSFCGRSDCHLQRSFLPSPFCLGHSHGMEREKSCQSCTIGTKKKRECRLTKWRLIKSSLSQQHSLYCKGDWWIYGMS